MADQYLDWGVPGDTDRLDVTTELSLGIRFTISANRPCRGVRFYVAATRPTLPSPAYVSIWNIEDEVTPLAVGEFEWEDLTPDGWAIVPLDGGPIDLVTTETYVAAYQTYEHWAGTLGYSFPQTDGIITALSPNGYLRVPTEFGYPNFVSPSSASYLVSPVMVVPAPEGSASGAYGGLTGAATGHRAKNGSASGAYGGLTGLATGRVPGIVSRPNTGTVVRPNTGTVTRP